MGGRGAWAAARKQSGEVASWTGPGFRIGIDEIPSTDQNQDVIQYIDEPEYFTGVGRIRAEPEPELSPEEQQRIAKANLEKALKTIQILPGPAPEKGFKAKMRQIAKSVKDFAKSLSNVQDITGPAAPQPGTYTSNLSYHKQARANRKRLLGFDPDDYR